jgi:hypothetical protein
VLNMPCSDPQQPSRVVPATRMEELLTTFIRALEAHGYTFRPLDRVTPDFGRRNVYVRHDVQPEDLEAALRLAFLHERLQVPASFHLNWDLIDDRAPPVGMVHRFRDFDPAYVGLGLQCDPISGWLLQTRFHGGESELAGFVASPAFHDYLGEMLAAWQRHGAAAPSLASIREGACERLAALDRSFRQDAGEPSSISGRGSPLSNAFYNARRALPALGSLAPWFSAIDLLLSLDLDSLGYGFEATRFLADNLPGPVVMFGGSEITRLRDDFATRTAAGGGFLAIFSAGYWERDRYVDLLPGTAITPTATRSPGAAVSSIVVKPPVPEVLPPAAPPASDRPVLTNIADLVAVTPTGASDSLTEQLVIAARQKVGHRIDADFPRFIEWLRREDYAFGGFEEGPPRFDERRAYLRHDVHIQDLLAAYVMADLHQRLGMIGSFQITWKFSRYEEAAEPYFIKLMDFDRRFVQFGLHAAPTATWFLEEKLAGEYTRQREAVASDDFVSWLLELHASYESDGDAAPELRRIREGTDDTIARIAASFRATFGDWKSISGHGNFLTNGFAQACISYPQLKVLQPYFHPVTYMATYGVERFGFDFEITSFGADRLPYPRVLMEGADAVTRRRWFRGRVASGAGFVALFHPASWTCSHNSTFFLPPESGADGGTGSP